ncbi:hypothetical protein C4J88_3224 [Pseudomonas sp. R4-39-08]|nr:hypothetical protein C4J88_3224 [Pseudomonas sp. R4-39-08]
MKRILPWSAMDVFMDKILADFNSVFPCHARPGMFNNLP